MAQNIARNCALPVFPCGDNKKPCIGKREGGNGFHDASIDPAQIERLFSHPGAALIGIATGNVSGIDLLDIDIKHQPARAWLLRVKKNIPRTRVYQTRGGGYHLWFRHEPGVHNTESHIAQGVDTRGDGGYLVYWYGAGLPCTDHSPAAEWPDWLLEAIFYKPKPDPIPARGKTFRSDSSSVQNLIATSISKVQSAGEGQRHATLRAAACTIGGVIDTIGMSRGEATRLLFDAVLVAGGARIDQRNALGTIAWGLHRGAASPLIGP